MFQNGKKDELLRILERHGIDDPYEFLVDKEKKTPMGRSSHPDVMHRGSIPLMRGRKISREEVEEGFQKLKYF